MWLSAAIAMLVVLPATSLLLKALTGSNQNLLHLIDTILLHAARETVFLLLGVGVLVATIGTGTAWLVSAYEFRGRRIVEWALLLPLAVPTYIIAFAYLDILHPIGPVQSALRAVLGFTSPQDLRLPDIRSLPGCILLLGFVLYPYVYVPVRAMFLMQAGNMIEASRTLGVSRRGVFWRVALPLARPAIAIGTSFALIETLNDIGASEFLGVRTLTVSVYSTWINKSDLAGAAQISLFMLLIVFCLVTLERKMRKNQRFANSAQKPSRMQPIPLNGSSAAGALALCMLPVAVGFLAPLAYLLSAALRRIADAGMPANLLSETINTLGIATAATAITLLLGMASAYATRTRPGRVSKAFMRIASLGYALPGTVVAIGVLFPAAAFDQLLHSYFPAAGLILVGTGAALIYAYSVRFLAIAAGNVESGLSRIPRSLDFAARSLGETASGTLRKVHLPIAKPALAAASLLLFVDCVKELPATLMLRPLNFETFATHLYAEAARGTYEDGAIAALAIVIIGIIPLILLSRLGRRETAFPVVTNKSSPN
jgi:iron(III) transport system permease protein